jgi:5-methylcytosine-specific restriction protein A
MDKSQRARFGAAAGAFSTVTDTEAEHDRSITIDRFEKRVLERIYPVAGLTRGHGNARCRFIVHSRTDFTVESNELLSLKFPKPKGNELRLYMSASNSFDARRSDYFYIFTRDSDHSLHVGFMPRADWDLATYPSLDDEDETYQNLIFAEIGKKAVQTTLLRIPRSLLAASTAIIAAKFQCEVDPLHETFTCSATGKPYVEAHHLMPLSTQGKLGKSTNVDIPENILALCPMCHRRLHHQEESGRKVLLTQLFSNRSAAWKASGFDFDLADLLKAYGLV